MYFKLNETRCTICEKDIDFEENPLFKITDNKYKKGSYRGFRYLNGYRYISKKFDKEEKCLMPWKYWMVDGCAVKEETIRASLITTKNSE